MVQIVNTKQKTALITGITGQDGYYMAEYLCSLGYKVHGLVRPTARARRTLVERQQDSLDVQIHYGDLLDISSLVRILSNINCDEIYHFAAQSHVGISFDMGLMTHDINAMGTIRLLEAVTMLNLQHRVKFYNACTSEIFGNCNESPQSETTVMRPVSPYAVAKLSTFWHVRNIRATHNMFAVNGILFNHESPRRGIDFVTRRITSGVALIKYGQAKTITLGNLDARRDWGCARDFMRGVHAMLQHNTPDDFVLATGKNYTVREFVEHAFEIIGVEIQWSGCGLNEVGRDAATGHIRVRVSSDSYRPLETDPLLGNPEKAERILGWKFEVQLDQLVRQMVLADLDLARAGKLTVEL